MANGDCIAGLGKGCVAGLEKLFLYLSARVRRVINDFHHYTELNGSFIRGALILAPIISTCLIPIPRAGKGL